MCGIIGHFSQKKIINKKTALNMVKLLQHRGPDDFGIYLEDDKFLGHTRLAIQDPSDAGHQPMWNKDNSIGIVFNGEIYNFHEIKKELPEINFKSQTDTEVIIYAYQKWGLQKTLKKMNGMFAFCLYDKKLNKTYLVRDRIGIKPLVYYQDEENIIFSSEIKAILGNNLVKKEINKKAIYDFFIYRYIANPKTIFKKIFKLEPGYFLELDLNNFKLTKNCYWKLNKERYIDLSEDEIVKKIDQLLNESVRLRLSADTEVGTLLSGGIDSSLISVLAKNINPDIKAYNINIQPNQYSETKFAQKISQNNNIDLKIKTVGQQEFRKNFDEIISFYDEPFADSSIIPTFLLCQFVNNSGVKCVLSGDGADELFYGYNWYQDFSRLEKLSIINKIIPANLLKLFSKYPILKKYSLCAYDSIERYRKIMFDRFTINEVNHLFEYNEIKNENYLFQEKINKKSIHQDELNYLDFQSFLVDDILYKNDIASMANSVEIRMPFLDHHLVEFIFSIMFKYLYKNNNKKYLLKKVASQYLPSQNINRAKKGFSAPINKWTDNNYWSELQNGKLIKNNIISKEKLINFLKNEDDSGKIWQMYIFEKWYNNYMT